MRILLSFTILLASFVLTSFHGGPDDLKFIEDKDYCFRLEVPGKGWRLIDSKDLLQMSPRALAGAMSPEGTGFILAGPALTKELDEVPKAVFARLNAENKQLSDPTKIEFQHSPAVRFQIDGTTNGLLMRWDFVVVLHKDFTYQIIQSAPSAKAKWSTENLTPFHAAFSFLEGTPRVRVRSNGTDHAVGVGWEVDGGVFRSALFGLEAKVESPWRLVTGKELRNLSPSAHVGLRYEDPPVVVVFVMEKAAGSDLDSIAESSDERFNKLEHGTESMAARIVHHDALLEQRFSRAETGVEYLCGRLKIEDMLIQVMAWYPRERTHEARPLINQVLASTRLLEGDERTELIERLASQPDTENRVGPSYCLRHGVYQDFDAGFRWTKPRGFWRVRTGEDAHTVSKTCVIAMQNPSLGLFGLVHVTKFPGQDAARLIGPKMKVMFGEEQAKTLVPESIELGDVKGLTVSGVSTGKISMTYSLTVATTKDRVYQMVLSGTPKMVERSGAAVEAARRGLFILEEPVEPVVADGDTVRDERLGYELHNPDGWERTNHVMGPAFGVLGSAAGWSKGPSEIYIAALCPDTEGQDSSFMVDILKKQFLEQFNQDERGTVTESTEDFLGVPCKRMTWMDHTVELSVLMMLRDRTYYGLCSAGKVGSVDVDVAKRCFELLP